MVWVAFVFLGGGCLIWDWRLAFLGECRFNQCIRVASVMGLMRREVFVMVGSWVWVVLPSPS